MNDNKYTYIYDGSFEGFLCCVYTFYKERDTLVDIKTDDEQIEFFVKIKNIESKKENFDKVYEAIENKISFESLSNIYYAFLSEEMGRELKILDYIVAGFKYGYKVQDMLANNSIAEVMRMSKKTSSERHKFLGILRFKKSENGLFSFIEPTCNILPILGGHFVDRYVNEKFIIYDTRREYMLMYDTKQVRFFNIEKEKVMPYMDYKDEFEQIWKTYHKTMGIESRKNERCQRNFMPKKYWKNIVEMK